MGTIKCTDLCKNYRQKKVLDNVNLTIEEGKIYGLIGRNGAGKTTLLSIISAQNPASSGDVTLDGKQIWENEKALSDIFFSREFSANTMSGANKLLARFGLDKNQSINKLSKGMMSMVTIVVALASKAKFTFLDEPAAGLDVVARNDFYRLLIEEYTQSGRTFVISTHIIDEASDVFEEVIIVNHQKIALKENTAELLERAYHISGNKEDVDKMLTQNPDIEVLDTQNLGRSKGISILTAKNKCLTATEKLSVQPMTLQNLFVAICEEGR